MTPRRMPAAEIDIAGELVRRLLAAQHPDLADLPLIPAGNGWDNAIYRLGDDLAVRLPRRASAARLIENEQRWLSELAGRLTLPIPVPLRIGRPGDGYPWPWSVTPWFPGHPAAVGLPRDLDQTAITLGAFLTALHVEAPAEAPANPLRGGPLPGRDEFVREYARVLAKTVDTDAVLQLWDGLVLTRPWPSAPVWLHGDLHLANLIVHRGRLAAVVDFGDITAGDPATDLSVAWQLFDAARRRDFFARLGTDPDTQSRARGWALSLSMAYLANSADDPLIAGLGHRTLTAVLVEG